MGLVETTFSLGDVVYSAREIIVPQICPCRACEGRGFLLDYEKKQQICRKCGGARQETINYITKYEINKLTIGRIDVRITKNHFLEQYMCIETGITSGKVYQINNCNNPIFKTEKEALEFCSAPGNEVL